MSVATDLRLIAQCLDDHEDALTYEAREAFSSWRAQLRQGAHPRPLTDKQRAWLYGVAERLGLIGAAPAENLFSQWSPERQAEERRKAARVVLPWERK